MRIVVLGNCQANGLARGLAELLPDARVEVAQLEGGVRSPSGQAAQQAITGCDLLFTQRLDARFGPLATEALVAAGQRVVAVPLVIFRGYQPDMAYLEVNGRPVNSPVGAYHSAIVAASFSLGIHQGDVATLFNRLVYARLGYLDAFGKARTLLEEQFAPFGPAFGACFESWHARGPFMHTMNHPRVFVLADIARAAAIGAGLLRPDAPVVSPAFDHLARNVSWPVYPEIAEGLGVPGGLVFKRATLSHDPAAAEHVDLPAFIGECYARYAALPAATFRAGAIGTARSVLAPLLGCDPG